LQSVVERAGKAGPSAARLIVAASAGDQRALDALVAKSVPLVYTIVARTLSSDADIDDVVEDLMIRVVRDIADLRDPRRFRACLVAGAIDQIRAHRKRYGTASGYAGEHPDAAFDDDETAPPPDMESEQRQELEHAARWLDQEDRELLSLWWLELAGHLTAAEVTAALGLDAGEMERRVAKLTERLDAGRLLVRALVAVPVCPGLDEEAYEWPGEPTPAWRKRFFRHVGTCPRCCRAALDMLPIDELLTRPALLPLPSGYTEQVIAAVHEEMPEDTRAGEPAKAPRSRWRFFGTKPVVIVAGLAAACALGGSALVVPRLLSNSTGAAPSGPQPPSSSGPAGLPSSSAPGSSAAPPPPPAPPPAADPPAAPPRPPAPTAGPSRQQAPPSALKGPAEQVLALMNRARAAARLPAYRMDPGLVASALAHTQTMASGCGQSHQCPGEAPVDDRTRAAGVQWTRVGENIGSAGPVAANAVGDIGVSLTQLMLDEKAPDDDHRQNILSSAFTRVGIVVTRDSSGALWMTQDFAN
jgi:RNA polymerase sigma factor (sigma-70 family)